MEAEAYRFILALKEFFDQQTKAALPDRTKAVAGEIRDKLHIFSETMQSSDLMKKKVECTHHLGGSVTITTK